MQERKVELLAPAGNIEGFYGAIHAGADAVYLAGNRFGARAYAENFSEEQLVACIRYGHLFGKKIYMTVNTLVKEEEFSALGAYIAPYYRAGLDGVIVQDIGVFSYLRKNFPQMEYHASTQMTLTDSYGPKLLKQMGICRIVPARELSLKEIQWIKEDTGLSIEVFIHGAMCYCYSGQCLFSSVLGGRSGNRGRCAQPCRLPYQVQVNHKTSQKCHPLSLKDMCTIEMLPQLLEAGIDSFKIEGRMKKPEYAAGVTAIYRKYIDLYYQLKECGDVASFCVDPKDLEHLSHLYIRSERQDGYFKKHNGREMVTLDSPAYNGSDEDLLSEIRREYLDFHPKYQINMTGIFKCGEASALTASMGTLQVSVTGEPVQKADRRPVTKENIEKQLGKLGDTIFSLDHLELEADADIFIPLGAINTLRRSLIVKLEDALICSHGLVSERKQESKLIDERTEDRSFIVTAGHTHVSVKTMEQLWALLPFAKQLSRVYFESDLLVSGENVLGDLLNQFPENTELVVAFPQIIRARSHALLDQSFHLLLSCEHKQLAVMVRSIDGLGYLLERGYQGKIYADASFYTWNLETEKVWSRYLQGFCLPYELKGKEQMSLLRGSMPCEKIVYGRIPLMHTANCVARTTDFCRKDRKEQTTVWLIDRYRKKFPVELNCKHCVNVIYNSVPLSLHNELTKWIKKCDVRLAFTIESKKEVSEICQYFLEISRDDKSNRGRKPPYAEYTTGYESRGVE